MENYLHKCLSSVIVNDKDLMELLEVIVVNDGSTDRSSEIAHSYESQYPNTFRVIDKENGNYGSCVNSGLKEATGKYVKTLDADDYFDTDAFKGLLIMLQNTNSDMVVHYAQHVSSNNRTSEFGITSRKFGTKHKGRTFFTLEEVAHDVWFTPMMHNTIYRTSILKEMNYVQLEGIFYTDSQWMFLPVTHVKSITLYPHVVYLYLIGREGQTVSPTNLRKYFTSELTMTKEKCKEFAEYSGEICGLVYLKRTLITHLRYIYTFGISNERYNETDLRVLDKEIQPIIPDLWEEMNSWRIPVYKYRHSVKISLWRRDNGRWFYILEGAIGLFFDPYKHVKKLIAN